MVDSISSIVNTIDVKDDFSFVDTLGSFIGNRRFGETYQQFDERQNSPQAYVWYALSAIGNELGRTIHQNIRDYIDLVSNVDRCKIGNLQSMFNMYGQQYNIIDNISKYPIEVQNLMNIFSISRKYLLKNDFLNDDFRRELEENDVIVDCNTNIDSFYTQSNPLSISVMDKQFVQQNYDLYVKNVFKNLISGFLDLEYNDFGRTKIRKVITEDELRGYNLSSFDTNEDDTILRIKREKNIPQSFDEKKIVDDIDSGNDFIENYSGLELEIINLEIQKRVSTLVFKRNPGSPVIANTSNDSIEQKTRYSYYRKSKLIEYYNFVGNFFSQVIELSNVNKYAYDQSYFIFTQDNFNKVLYAGNEEGYEIDEKIVDQAAEILKDITLYITDLRERLKLQTRKNYMKGTANLLIYLINQYIVDYARTNTYLFNQLSSNELSSLKDILLKHSSKNVHVVEYFDETEYFNISAQTNGRALNGDTTNSRYWQGWDSQTTNQFTTDEIVRFYMKDLQLSSDSTVSNLIEFLDIIYNLGANSSYIDKSTGLFTAKISSDPDVYSITLHHALTSLQFHWDKFNKYILSDWSYQYPKDLVSNQISNVVDDYISGYLSVQNLSAISSVYEKYIGHVYSISSDVDNLIRKYNNFLSDDYECYFLSSSRPYCIDADGLYRYAFYIDSPEYTEKTIYNKLTSLQRFCGGEDTYGPYITFHGLHDTISALSTSLIALSGQYKGGTSETIYSRISGYGYVDLSSDTLNESLDNCELFIKQQIDSRLDYLKNLVAQLLQTARDIKVEYNTADTTFTNSVATYDDDNSTESITDSTIYTVSLTKTGKYKGDGVFKKQTKDPKDLKKSDEDDKSVVVCVKEGGYTYYYYSISKEEGASGYPFLKTSVSEYKSDDSLEDRCNAIIERLQVATAFTVDGDGNVDAVFYGRMNEGIYAVCESTKATLASIEASYNQLISTLADVGIKFDTKKESLKEKLDELIDKLTKTDASIQFSDDPTLSDLNEIKRKIITLRSEYNPRYNEYSKMPSDKDFSKYIGNFNFKSEEYSFKQLSELFKYVEETDEENRKKISEAIDDMFSDHTTLKTRFNDVEISASQELVNYDSSGDAIEQQLVYLEEALLQDVQDRTYTGTQKILSTMEDVRFHMEFIQDSISDFLDSSDPLSDVVQTRIEQLDYRDSDEYTTQLSLYQMYNGLCANSDIYYNYKNITHPSRQYHPYLWNLIDVDEFSQEFQNTFNLNTIQDLEEESIQNNINQYIGEFGQSINLWKNEGIDYTGYSSRYEASNHVVGDKQTRFHKVVDYDGAFYPDAVAYFRKYGAQRCIDSIQYGIDGTNQNLSDFYSEYYEPLGLSQKELKEEQARIRTFQTQISVLTNPTEENKVYDIYKYGLDQYDNSYCLFKIYLDENGNFYDVDRITENIKKNTSGKLWVRKSAYPFAFPAFSNENGLFDIDNQYTAFLSAVSSEMQRDSTNLSGNIYDFEFSKNKTELAFITKNYTGDVKRFGTANLFVSNISKKMDQNGIDYRLTVKDYSLVNVERVEKNLPKNERASEYKQISSLTLNDVSLSSAQDVINSEMSVIFSGEELNQIYPNISAQGTPAHNITSDYGYLYSIRFNTINDIRGSTEISNILSATDDKNYLTGYSNGYVYDFVGCQLKGNNNFYFVFAKKRYETNNDLKTEVTLESGSNFKVINYQSGRVSDAGGIQFPRTPTTEDVVVSMSDTKQMAFGVLVSSMLSDDTTMIDAYNLSSRVLSSSNSNGYVQYDPVHEEMNSHDVFTSDVFVRKYQVNYTTLDQVGNDMIFNVNGDISYLPVYPGKQEVAEFNKRVDISANSYYPVELLGQSKNIDDLIEMVNPTPNPYFTIDEISTNNVFGRVYEDYVSDYDKTAKIIGNPPIHNNIPSTLSSVLQYSLEDGEFVWSIDLKKSFIGAEYTDNDYKTLRVLMFNRNNFGKNPYIVCDLSSAIDNEVVASYNSDSDGFEINIGGNIDVTGTYDNKSVNSLESNRLNNISKISIRFIKEGDIEDGTRTLEITFTVKDKSKIDNTFINEDQICLCLMNDRDLSIFKYYHYLDAYGIYISAETLDYSMYDEKEGDGYKIQYDNSFIASKLSGGYWNYFFDKYGRKEYLRDIDFDKYNYLSDIEVLQGYKKAIFKYDEELYFDPKDTNYYYPTVNIKYPKSLGSYITEKSNSMNVAEEINLASAFRDNELFLIDIPDSSQIFKSIGQIRIDISSDNSGFLMVDEDFFEGSEHQYSIDDPRIFEQLILTEGNKTEISSDISAEISSEISGEISSDISAEISDEISSDISSEISVYVSNEDIVEDASELNDYDMLMMETDDVVIADVSNKDIVEVSSELNGHDMFQMETEGGVIVDVSNKDIVEVANELSGYGMFPMETEGGITVETKIIDVRDVVEDISKLLRIYVNYKKDMDNENGIVLYFNYSNYLNTPFIKLDEYKTIEYDSDGKPVLDENGHAKRIFQEYRVFSEIIEGTYLKLSPGENGKLDIVLQFRYLDDNTVRGVKNVKVLTYQIFNISDDKPKFVIREVYRVGKYSSSSDSTYNINIYGAPTKIYLNDIQEAKEFTHTISWNTTVPLSRVKFDITFNGEIFRCMNSSESNVTIDTSISPSVASITITNPTTNRVDIPFSYSLPDEQSGYSIEEIQSPHEVVIDEISIIPKSSEHIINIVNVVNGFVEIELS